MDLIKSNSHYLKILAKGEPKLRKFILSNARKKLINCLTECVYNTLYNKKIKFNPTKKEKLKKYKKSLRRLSNLRTTLRERKQILNQKGSGFLPLILPAVLSLISSFAIK